MSSHWPPLIINLKQIVTGEKVSRYVTIAGILAQKYEQPLIVCVNNAEIYEVIEAVKRENVHLFDFLHVFGQTIDPVAPGQSETGSTTPSVLIDLDAHGSLLNHFENRLYGHNPGKRDLKSGFVKNRPEDFEHLMKTIKLGVLSGLNLVVCADGLQTVKEIVQTISSQEFLEEIFNEYCENFLNKLLSKAYFEFERVYGRFPEGVSKGSFKKVDFPDIFFGMRDRSLERTRYFQFLPLYKRFEDGLKACFTGFVREELREELLERIKGWLYRKIAVAVEWDELIGKGEAIVKKQPETVRNAVEIVRKINPSLAVYCGAGVQDLEDILIAKRELGATGALAASAFAMPFRESPWIDTVKSYLSGISSYYKVQKPLEEGDEGVIRRLRDNLYGLKLVKKDGGNWALLSLLQSGIYRGAGLVALFPDKTYKQITAENLEELKKGLKESLIIYGEGPQAFHALKDLFKAFYGNP